MGPTGTSGSVTWTVGVPADTSGAGGISMICGGSTGGGRGSDSSASSTHSAMFSYLMGDGDLLAQDSGSDNSVGRDDVEVTPDSEAYDSEGDTGALTTGRGRG